MSGSDRLRVSLFAVAVLVTIGSKTAQAGFCPWCGQNAATVYDGVVFDELNVDGVSRGDHPRITGAAFKGISVKLQVTGDQLEAVETSGSGIRHKFNELTGLTVHVKASNGRSYELTWGPYSPVLYWSTPRTEVPAYVIFVKKTPMRPPAPNQHGRQDRGRRPPAVSNVEEHLCTSKRSDPTDDDPEYYAIAFTGDRYEANHTITPQPQGWFNLACRGTAAAKMHLLRHTIAGAFGKQTTTRPQREAMLGAITADYCGDGTTWTGDGTPLYWTDRTGRFPLVGDQGYPSPSTPTFPEQIEAVWVPSAPGRPGKLLCLNEPRRTPANVTAACTPPAVVRADVMRRSSCRRPLNVPRCDALSSATLVPGDPFPDSLSGGYIVTVNDWTRPHDYCGSR